MGEETNKYYIGITLGPIHRFLGCAKSTRSIWASSYLFAYIGKHIIRKYYESKCRILKPQISDEMFSMHDGVGRFPDQYIFEVDKEFDINGLREESDAVLDNLAYNIAQVLGEKQNEYEVNYYLKQALRIIIVKKSFLATMDDSDVVKAMQGVLAEQECRDTFLSRESRNYLSEYFESKIPDMLLYVDAYGKECKGRMFDTIVECSAGNDYNGKKVDLIEGKLDSQLNPYQKYIAFVAADGDSFGEMLSKQKQFAIAVRKYNKQVNELVRSYGGEVIYQGGDDILFYAPLFSLDKGKAISEGKDILSLIADIDNSLYKILNESSLATDSPHLTISYGISVSYFKFPMGEAMEIAQRSLQEAKNSGKNRIVWTVRKHSGQTYGDVIDKSIPLAMRQSIDFIHDSLGDNDAFLHSVTHWLIGQEAMLGTILSKENNRERSDMLDNYIQNCFNEPEHDKYEAFFDSLKKYLLAYSGDEGVNKLHVLMRYVELLKKKKS